MKPETPLTRGTEAFYSSNVIRITTVLVACAAVFLIVACGEEDAISGSGESADAQVVPEGAAEGELKIANWPLYVDPGKDGTIAEFERETGIEVEYVEEINDNAQFFGKIQPQLAQGESGGRSLITVSDWLAGQMHELGYLYEFDKSKLPNVEANLIPALREADADPDRDFTVPWQSGMTGLIVRTDLAPEIDEVADLFDPEYKGQVDMLTEMRDTVPMTLKSLGIDPETASQEEWLEAVEAIDKAADAGQIRRFTGNDYIRDLASGDVVAALGWSGDAVQLQKDNPDIQFVMPEEGCMLWSTSLEIPVGAPNPQAAQEFINFVYDPEVQADIAEYVNYVTPVAGVKEILEERNPELAENELIFPSEEYTADCSFEPVLSGADGEEITKAFQDAISG